MKMSGGVETKGEKQMTAYTQDSFACAINDLVSELIGDLKIDIGVDSNSEKLEASVKDEIYLIAREAVTNIKLHAEAERRWRTPG